MKGVLTFALWSVVSLGHAVELEVGHCKFPTPPSLADGASATEEEMATTGSAVREFVSAMQASLDCLDKVQIDLGKDITAEQEAALTALYNNGVDQMQALAGAYNEQIRAYKER